MYPLAEHAEAGALIASGASRPDLCRRAAAHVDKILRGTRSADLPTEQSKRVELVVRLKTAKGLALTMPPSFFAAADGLIGDRTVASGWIQDALGGVVDGASSEASGICTTA